MSARRIRRSHPAISRSRANALPFNVAAICWVDLLGYGDMIAAANLNPIDPLAKPALERLRGFHRIVAEHSDRHFRTLVLNDGAAAYRDLSLRNAGVTHDFLSRSFELHEALQAFENGNGWPGARMILSVGFRAKGSRRAIDRTAGRVELLIEQLRAGEIAPEEAVRAAAKFDRYFDVIPQLQANFAFTRAYVADVMGSRAGLGANLFYVDAAIFEDDIPNWVEAGERIRFTDARLKIDCEFVPLFALRRPADPGGTFPGLRDGVEIAEAIAPTVHMRAMIQSMG